MAIKAGHSGKELHIKLTYSDLQKGPHMQAAPPSSHRFEEDLSTTPRRHRAIQSRLQHSERGTF